MRRTLRWDGIVTQTESVAGIAAIVEYVQRERPVERRGNAFDIVVQGSTQAGDPDAAAAVVAPYAAAGATWWLDADWGAPTVESVRSRIAAGPPAVS
jgi:hypothetical protein